MIYWLTGQPGAGKTTIAKTMLLETECYAAFHIDGDHIREIFDNKDYSELGRRKNVEIAQSIAEYLHKEGETVVVSMVSPYKDQRDKFKEKIGKNFFEIYVHTNELRGRENFFVKDYHPPTENYIDVCTDSDNPESCVNLIFMNTNIK